MSLNPFFFRAGFEAASEVILRPLGRLNPFFFRAGFEGLLWRMPPRGLAS